MRIIYNYISIYRDKKEQPTLYVICYTGDQSVEIAKLNSVHKVKPLPLLEDMDITLVDKPARQQLHSLINYVKNNYELITTTKASTAELKPLEALTIRRLVKDIGYGL